MRDDAKSEYEALKAECDEMEASLLERMESEEVDSMKTNGLNYVPAQTPYGSVNDRAEFIKWAQENGQEELLEVKERKKLINQIARRHLDDGEPLPPGMSFYVKDYISIRAA